jgi:hypothetical protein
MAEDADLGNGIYLYPFLAIGGVLALIAALLVVRAATGHTGCSFRWQAPWWRASRISR